MTDQELSIVKLLRALQRELWPFAKNLQHANGVYNGIEIALSSLTGEPPRLLPRPEKTMKGDIVAEAERILKEGGHEQ